MDMARDRYRRGEKRGEGVGQQRQGWERKENNAAVEGLMRTSAALGCFLKSGCRWSVF